MYPFSSFSSIRSPKELFTTLKSLLDNELISAKQIINKAVFGVCEQQVINIDTEHSACFVFVLVVQAHVRLALIKSTLSQLGAK